MSEVVGSVDQVDATWLTEVLRAAGVLPRGIVDSVAGTHMDSFTAHFARLALSYSDDVPDSAPRSLFLKWSGNDGRTNLAEREAAFYSAVLPRIQAVPCPRCYDVAHVPGTGAYHLLLEDLTGSHDRAESPEAITDEAAGAGVDALATLHATWWDSPDLAELSPAVSVDTERDSYGDIEKTTTRFLEDVGPELPAGTEAFYWRLLDRLWSYFESIIAPRYDAGKGLTVIHGDAHPGNCLYPHVPGQQARLIDWQFWGVGLPMVDLAAHVALGWRCERRAKSEKPLIERYHRRLMQKGVQDYPLEQCWQDYRMAVLDNVTMPVVQWNMGMPETMWRQHFPSVITNYYDLDCDALLRGEE